MWAERAWSGRWAVIGPPKSATVASLACCVQLRNALLTTVPGKFISWCFAGCIVVGLQSKPNWINVTIKTILSADRARLISRLIIKCYFLNFVADVNRYWIAASRIPDDSVACITTRIEQLSALLNGERSIAYRIRSRMYWLQKYLRRAASVVRERRETQCVERWVYSINTMRVTPSSISCRSPASTRTSHRCDLRTADRRTDERRLLRPVSRPAGVKGFSTSTELSPQMPPPRHCYTALQLEITGQSGTSVI